MFENVFVVNHNPVTIEHKEYCDAIFRKQQVRFPLRGLPLCAIWCVMIISSKSGKKKSLDKIIKIILEVVQSCHGLAVFYKNYVILFVHLSKFLLYDTIHNIIYYRRVYIKLPYFFAANVH